VIAVVQIPDGIAVVADTYWHPVKARDLLQVDWDDGPNANLSTAAMSAGTQAALATGKPIPHKKVGDADAVVAAAAKVVRAEYRTQHLAHAPMEPMNYTAHFEGDRIRLVGPTQWPDAVQGAVAKMLNLKVENVAVESTFLGGGFGRRIDFDYVLQAAQIAKAVPNKPVKLVWSREDDMQHDFYRPLGVHQIAAALGADGKPTALTWRVASQSVTARAFGLPPEAPDGLMTEAATPLYDIPAIRQDVVKHDVGIRVGYWRAVSHNMNAFANESFIDECAAAAGKDPVAYRLSMLDAQPRMANVLKQAAATAGWAPAPGRPLPRRVDDGGLRHLHGAGGRDLHQGWRAGGAQGDGGGRPGRHGQPRHRAGADPVQRDLRLSGVLWSEITVDKGRVQQFNFDRFRVMRNNEAPQIDIVLVPSKDKPGGIGEPATALIGPAVANAVFAATGKRVRRMPLTAEALAQA
jgi:isoquinoline 1-oxidoreductase beta subunit